MLTTVLFDMGGTLEDIWNNKETQAKVKIGRASCRERV